jgi:hypothetical protein
LIPTPPDDAEYELTDTGVFDAHRYFDVQVEYAKADAEDILIRIRVTNRGPEVARLHVLPTIWFRNVWSWYALDLAPGETTEIRLRFSDVREPPSAPFDDFFTATFDARIRDAGEFYARVLPAGMSDDARNVARQAIAGLLWSKQFYHYVVRTWLQGDPGQPSPPPERVVGRNADWTHVYNDDVLSVPDKWEFPWYASWDLAFHAVALAIVDVDFAKDQLYVLFGTYAS